MSFTRRDAVILSIHALSIVGLSFLSKWLWNISHTFGTQHRSTDRTYGIVAFTVFVVAAVSHGCMLVARILTLAGVIQRFEDQPSKQDWRSLLAGLATRLVSNIVLIVANIVLLIRFSNWLRQFQTGGEANNSIQCVGCILFSAFLISWEIIYPGEKRTTFKWGRSPI
jgi:hypothetical protein